jgi:tRNA(Leu) C34 or U34 (ribose-2'-O)-methylase TrmL
MGLQHFHHVESLAPFKPADYHYARWMTVHRHEAAAPCMEELKKEGFTILATTLSPTAVSLDRLDLTNRKVAVVFGNETHGVSSSTLELADAHVTLPMLGFTQSYNVSVASALVLSRLLITTPMLPVCVPAGAEDPRRRPPEWPAMLQNFLDWQLPSQTAPPPTTGPLAVSDTPLPPPLLNAAPLGTDERLALTASFLLQSSKFGIQLLRQKGIFLEGM